jgi:hypothetical protein
LISPDVTLDDLRCPIDFVSNGTTVYGKGCYNPYNKWNSTHGIMHLGHPSNSLSAEIGLGALATVIFKGVGGGDPVVLGEALICAGQLGGPNRTSDPTIASTVNDLARLGAAITLRNPVGLYMDSIDLTGFQDPSGGQIPREFFRVIRGDEKNGLVERAVFEVPKSERYVVGDITVAGQPIHYGGQIAEHIKVKLVGVGSALGSFSNAPVPSLGHCCVSTNQPLFLRHATDITSACGAGMYSAFSWGGNPQGSMPPPEPAFRAIAKALEAPAVRPKFARYRVR